MKKLTALIFAAVMIFVLCGCQFGEIPDYGGKFGEAGDVIGIPNPVAKSDAAGVRSAVGIELKVPEGASNVHYSIIDGDLGQVKFVYDGNEYCYRATKTDSSQDISGVYFGAVHSFPVGDCLFRLDSQYGAATWFGDGYSYSISMDISDENALVDMYKLLK